MHATRSQNMYRMTNKIIIIPYCFVSNHYQKIPYLNQFTKDFNHLHIGKWISQYFEIFVLKYVHNSVCVLTLNRMKRCKHATNTYYLLKKKTYSYSFIWCSKPAHFSLWMKIHYLGKNICSFSFENPTSFSHKHWTPLENNLRISLNSNKCSLKSLRTQYQLNAWIWLELSFQISKCYSIILFNWDLFKILSGEEK